MAAKKNVYEMLWAISNDILDDISARYILMQSPNNKNSFHVNSFELLTDYSNLHL